MTLVDTSVWIDHFRRTDSRLVALLEDGRVVTHDFVIGELACGRLARRDEILMHVRALPFVERLDEAEVHAFVSKRKLHGSGVGWIDAHLLAAAVLADSGLWTLDRRLQTVAAELGVRV